MEVAKAKWTYPGASRASPFKASVEETEHVQDALGIPYGCVDRRQTCVPTPIAPMERVR
jgi:hypothetical protein